MANSDPTLLLAKHVPQLCFDSNEQFFLLAVEDWIEAPGTSLVRADGTVIAASDPRPDVPRLTAGFLDGRSYPTDATVEQGDTLTRHGTEPPEGGDRSLARHRRLSRRCYGRAKFGEGGLWLQYWFFYQFDDYRFAKHEGDWEMIQLRFGHRDKPDQAVYAQAAGAERRPWNEVQRVEGKPDTPIVYVARGSHACYFEPGMYVTEARYDVADGRRLGPPLSLEVLHEEPQGWLAWPGRWGASAKGRTTTLSSSPRGPAFHAQWQDPRVLLGRAHETAPPASSSSLPAPEVTAAIDGDRLVVRFAFPPSEVRPAQLLVSIDSPDEPLPPATYTFDVSATSGAVAVPAALEAKKRYGVYVTGVTRDGLPSLPTLRMLKPRGSGASAASVGGSSPGAINDQIGSRDELGFATYVRAFADLIESPDTQPPLTIGIFGSWGMGKSFILQHINQELERRNNARAELLALERTGSRWTRWLRGQPVGSPAQLLRRRFLRWLHWPRAQKLGQPWGRVHAVEFNAWTYSATEVIWPGLVRKVMDQLERQIRWGFPGRRLRRIGRNLHRLSRRDRTALLAISGLVTLVAIVVGIGRLLGLAPSSRALLATLGLAGAGASLVALVSKNLKPLGHWVAAAFQEDDYGRQIGLMEAIRDDLDDLQSRLAIDGSRILITIDDLDRCEPEKSVEVLQAINLLLNFPAFVVCLGVDARIVTRAIERHYKGLLDPAGATGYEYLDKVIQIPFRIPEPGPEEIRRFISLQMGDPPAPEALTLKDEVSEQAMPEDGQEPDGPVVRRVDHGREEAPDEPAIFLQVREEAVRFTWEELQAFNAVAPVLRSNPRHVKRIINVYRLVRSLAQLDQQPVILEHPDAVVRWLVAAAQWPYTTNKMLHRFRVMSDECGGRLDELPEGDAMAHLHGLVRNDLEPDLRNRLDADTSLLDRLMEETEPSIAWAQLKVLERYTINFNPAVEAELSVLTSAKSADDPDLGATAADRSPNPASRRAASRPSGGSKKSKES
jgi:hypothetical protein